MSDCGGCANFTKMKTLEGASGLCEWEDCRTSTDRGHQCPAFRPMKFERRADAADIKRLHADTPKGTRELKTKGMIDDLQVPELPRRAMGMREPRTQAVECPRSRWRL
jgi:hypothetical protein